MLFAEAGHKLIVIVNLRIRPVLLCVLCLTSLVIADASTLEGTVCASGGKPIKGADVRLKNVSPKRQLVCTKTDERGNYRFSNVAGGVYKLTVLCGDAVCRSVEGVRVNGTKQVDFDIRPPMGFPSKKAKRLVWVPPETGTNVGGRWVEVDEGQTSNSRFTNSRRADTETIFRFLRDAPASNLGGSALGQTIGAFRVPEAPPGPNKRG